MTQLMRTVRPPRARKSKGFRNTLSKEKRGIQVLCRPAKKNTEVVVQGVFSTSSYATIVRNADGLRIDGFDVTGTVDTIWAGEKYYEIGDTRLITVRADGKVAEGIEVTSSGYTINNYGKITRPGQEF